MVPDAVFGADALGRPAYFTGDRLAKLFASSGAKLTAIPKDTVALVDDRNVYGAPGTVDNALAWGALGFTPTGAAMWHNVIIQSNGNHPASFALSFGRPVKAVRFIRAGLIAGAQGVSHPEWWATARDVRGKLVARVHEGPIATYSGVPPRSFELAGTSEIGSVTFSGDNHGFAAFTNVVLQLIGWCY